jgi:hypothetical protein
MRDAAAALSAELQRMTGRRVEVSLSCRAGVTGQPPMAGDAEHAEHADAGSPRFAGLRIGGTVGSMYARASVVLAVLGLAPGLAPVEATQTASPIPRAHYELQTPATCGSRLVGGDGSCITAWGLTAGRSGRPILRVFLLKSRP